MTMLMVENATIIVRMLGSVQFVVAMSNAIAAFRTAVVVARTCRVLCEGPPRRCGLRSGYKVQ